MATDTSSETVACGNERWHGVALLTPTKSLGRKAHEMASNRASADNTFRKESSLTMAQIKQIAENIQILTPVKPRRNLLPASICQ